MTNLKTKTENCPQFSRDESVFVKMGELFAHFDKNILILRRLGTIFCLFLMIFVSAYLTSLGVSYPCKGVGRFEKFLSGCLSAKIKASAHSQHHGMDPSMQKLS